MAQPTPDRWAWLADALRDPDRRHFVARVFERQPVPKALFDPMLDAALSTDANECQWYVRPLVESFGVGVVREAVAASGASSRRVAYWLRDQPRRRAI